MTNPGSAADEQPIDVHQYARALRVALPRIAKFAVAAALIAVAVAFVRPSHPTYTASATLLARDTLNSNQAAGSTAVAQRLATVSLLTGTSSVLADAAAKLHGTTVAELRSTVHSSVDPNAGAITISAEASTPAVATATANEVARALISAEQQIEAQAMAEARSNMLAEIAHLRARGADKVAIQAVENQLAAITAGSIASPGGFQVIHTGEHPVRSSPTSPILSGAVVFCAVALLGMLFVLAREQISPRVSSLRDVGELFSMPVATSIPVVTSLPFFSRLKGRDLSRVPTAVRDAFYVLAGTVRDEARRHDARVVLVTSAVRGEGRTAVSANLGQALGASGTRVLVVSADLRGSRAEDWLGTSESPGLTDVLRSSNSSSGGTKPVSVPTRVNQSAAAGRRTSGNTRARKQTPAPLGGEPTPQQSRGISVRGLQAAIRRSPIPNYSTVNVLPAGTPVEDNMGVLFGEALPSLFTQLRKLPVDVVVLDGPPVLESADFAELAHFADAILVVVRADRMAMGTAAELRQALEPFEEKPRLLALIDRRRHALTPRTYEELQEGNNTGTKIGDREVVELR
jgi:Mrp family chromosome partitioning ATPase